MRNVIELIYPATIQRDGKYYLVTFRNIENAFTQGKTLKEAIFNAREVLDLMLLDRVEKDEHIPRPSTIRKGEYAISPSPEVAAPVLLHMLRQESNRSMADIAHAMHVPYQSYQRMETGKNLTMKSIKRAAEAMGAIVEIRLRKIDINLLITG